MANKSEYVKRWRKKCKQRIIDAMGGSCVICGYNKCHSALVLHHLDPSKKDFELGSIRANPKNWNAIVNELQKCVLVCQNCHCELHENKTSIPNNHAIFNEKYSSYKYSLLK